MNAAGDIRTSIEADLQRLQGHLRRVRRRQIALSAVAASGATVAAAVGYVAVVVLVDAVFELPWWLRLVLLLTALSAGASRLWRYAGRRLWRPPDDDEVALWVEADQPALRQRLISSVQLGREVLSGGAGAGSPELVRSLLAETASLLEPADLGTVTPSDAAYVWGGGGIGAALVLLLALSLGGESVTARVLRALGVPGVDLPRRTTVEVIAPVRDVLPRGDDVTVEARAAGVVPRSGRLRVRFAGGAERNLTMSPVADDDPARQGHFVATLTGVVESFTFEVQLNDGRSTAREVRVVPRPTPRRVDVTVQPPAYVGGEAQTRPAGELSVLEGSRLSVRVEASRPLGLPPGSVAGRLVLLGESGVGFPKQLPLRMVSEDGAVVAAGQGGEGGVTVTRGLRGMAVVLADADGIETRDPRVYAVDVVPDRPPVLRVLTRLRPSDIVTRRATLRITYEAEDDLGLAAVRLRYRVRPPDSEPSAEPAGTPSDRAAGVGDEAGSVELLGDARTRRVEGSHVWRLSELQDGAGVPEGHRIEWWVEAVDINTATGPGVARSPVYVLRIGTEAEVREVLMARLEGVVGELHDARSVQEQAAEALGEWLIERPLRSGGPPPPATGPALPSTGPALPSTGPLGPTRRPRPPLEQRRRRRAWGTLPAKRGEA
ncbi:MAG: DUF4175 family protein [Tepidisphaerales bacterium]